MQVNAALHFRACRGTREENANPPDEIGPMSSSRRCPISPSQDTDEIYCLAAGYFCSYFRSSSNHATLSRLQQPRSTAFHDMRKLRKLRRVRNAGGISAEHRLEHYAGWALLGILLECAVRLLCERLLVQKVLGRTVEGTDPHPVFVLPLHPEGLPVRHARD